MWACSKGWGCKLLSVLPSKPQFLWETADSKKKEWTRKLEICWVADLKSCCFYGKRFYTRPTYYTPQPIHFKDRMLQFIKLFRQHSYHFRLNGNHISFVCIHKYAYITDIQLECYLLSLSLWVIFFYFCRKLSAYKRQPLNVPRSTGQLRVSLRFCDQFLSQCVL
jgi:hypothetical protein